MLLIIISRNYDEIISECAVDSQIHTATTMICLNCGKITYDNNNSNELPNATHHAYAYDIKETEKKGRSPRRESKPASNKKESECDQENV